MRKMGAYEFPSDTMNLDDLIKLKGIGPKTLADIKRIYHNIDELKAALRANKVPLRDDVVELLKKALLG